MIRYRRSVLCVCPLLVSLFLAASMAPAQTTGGSLLVVVIDAAGAPTSGADVTAKNERTGEIYHAQEHMRGAYVLPEMTPGSYTVSAASDAVTGVAVEAATRFFVMIKGGSGRQAATTSRGETR